MLPESLEIGKLYKFNKKFLVTETGKPEFIYFSSNHDGRSLPCNKNDYFVIVDEDNKDYHAPRYVVLLSGNLVIIIKDFLREYSELVNDE